MTDRAQPNDFLDGSLTTGSIVIFLLKPLVIFDILSAFTVVFYEEHINRQWINI